MVTVASIQLVGSISPSALTMMVSGDFSTMSSTLLSPSSPITAKVSVIRVPEPLTPLVPGSFEITLIVSFLSKHHISIGISFPPIFPGLTSVTFTTPGSNDNTKHIESRSTTSVISMSASNVSVEIYSGALTVTSKLPMLTVSSVHFADTGVPSLYARDPPDMFSRLSSPTSPTKLKRISTKSPYVRVPVSSGIMKFI